MLSESGKSSRRIAPSFTDAGTSISQSKVTRAARGMEMCFYRFGNGRISNSEAMKLRFQFAVEIIQRPREKTIDIHSTVWIDECYIGTRPAFDHQNDGIRRLSGTLIAEDHLRERAYRNASVNIFVAVHSRIRLIGPYFIEDIECSNDDRTTLSGIRYKHFLGTTPAPCLEEELGESFNTCWSLQDGTPPHTSEVARDFLREAFNGRLISLKKPLV